MQTTEQTTAQTAASENQQAVKGGPLKNLTGEYYVGMKREDAKNKSVFDKIDVNGDKKLSGKEICKQRDLECAELDKDKQFADTAQALGGGIVSGCALASVETGGMSLVGCIVGGIIGLGGVIYSCFVDDPDEARKETEQYRKEHKFDANY